MIEDHHGRQRYPISFADPAHKLYADDRINAVVREAPVVPDTHLFHSENIADALPDGAPHVVLKHPLRHVSCARPSDGAARSSDLAFASAGVYFARRVQSRRMQGNRLGQRVRGLPDDTVAFGYDDLLSRWMSALRREQYRAEASSDSTAAQPRGYSPGQPGMRIEESWCSHQPGSRPKVR